MRYIIILIFFGFFMIIGCANTNKKYQTFFDPEYKVIDRGELKVKLISRACSETFAGAFSAAKKNGEFHMRSVVGKINHAIKFREVSRYINKGKICVEMSASSLPP